MGVSSKKVKQTPIVTSPMQGNLFGGTPGTPATPAYTDPTTGATTPATAGTAGTPGFSQQIANFSAMDPHQFVAPSSPLQEQAYWNASQLGGWQPYMQNAMSLAQQAGAAPASQTSAQGYNPYQLGQAPQAAGAQLGQAPWMQASQLGDAAQYGGAQLGAAPEYGGADLGQMTQAQAAQMGAYERARAAGIGRTVNGQATDAQWQGILEGGGLGQYMNPANEAYVNNTLANYDANAAEQRGAMRAAQAGAHAFGGSRAGIQAGEFDAATGRQRALTESELRTKAFQDATNIGLSEVARKQNLGIFNAGQQTQVSQANAAQENARRMQLGQFGQQANMFNAGETNRRADLQAGYNQQTGMYNADMANQFARTQADLRQQAGLASQAMRGQYGLQQGQFAQQAGMANQAAQNQFAMSQAERQQAANAANQQMQGQYGLAQAGYDQATGQFNAGLASQYGLQQGQYANDAARYGAEAQNAANLSNAQLQEQAYQRQQAGAGMYGQLASQWGADQRADLTSQAALGETQRANYQAYLNAIPTQLQMTGGLYGMIPQGAYLGANQVTSGLGSWLPGVAGSAMQAAATMFGPPP